MLELELHFEGGTRERRRFDLPLDIGRDAGAGLRIQAWRVGRRHARIDSRQGSLFIQDHGALSGTWVNGKRIADYGPLLEGDEIVIGPCLMRILVQEGCAEHSGGVAAAAADRRGASDAMEPTATRCAAAGGGPGGSEAAFIGMKALRKTGVGMGTPGEAVIGVASTAAVRAETDDAVALAATEGAAGKPGGSSSGGAFATLPQDQLLRHRRRLHAELLEALDLRRRDIASLSDEALRAMAEEVLGAIVARDAGLPAGVDRRIIAEQVVNEAVGLGPLEPLLADHRISEIMVNRHDEIFIESDGRLDRHGAVFSSEQAVLGVIERIVSPLGRRIDESSPMVDARLRDGSRVNAVIPPIALRGASLTIRKFPQARPGMEDLLRVGALDHAMRDFLRACVRGRKNLIVSGGTGSGKTTLLNVLSNYIPDGERVITIEDAAELRLDHQHLVALEARPANLEGRGRIEIRDLVRNALRMRPDRIVIGECRGAEAFDMLAAMNTGHEGSLTTLHANSPRDALARLETMILMAGMDLPLSAVREHIAASIDFIVQQARLADGRRLLTSIVEVTGMESGRIQTQELFRYVQAPAPAFQGCGVLPECFMDEHGGSRLPASMFDQRTEVDIGRGAGVSPPQAAGIESAGRGREGPGGRG